MRLLGLFERFKGGDVSGAPIRLNLGCGQMYLNGWINVDVDPNVRSDLCCDLKSVKDQFTENTIDEVLMIHSLSYLRLWEARLFLRDCYLLLKAKGKLILEFPDVLKCSRRLIESRPEQKDYLEAVRGFYAFDMQQIKNRKSYSPYAFGWSAEHVAIELKRVGFETIIQLDPQTHGRLIWRDSRVEAIK